MSHSIQARWKQRIKEGLKRIQAMMRKAVFAGPALAIVGFALGAINIIWLATLLGVAALVAVVAMKYRWSTRGKVFFLIVAAGGLAALWWFGVLPAPQQPQTSMGSPLPLPEAWRPVAQDIRQAGAPQDVDPKAAIQHNWDRDVFGPDIERAATLQHAVSRFNALDRLVLALQPTHPDSATLRSLEDAVNELRPKMQLLDQRRVVAFVTQLQRFRRELYDSASVQDARAVVAKFDAWYVLESLNDIQSLRGRLEAVLNTLLAQTAKDALKVERSYVPTLLEQENKWRLDEQIRLHVAGGRITQIDLDPLVKLNRPQDPTPAILLAYSDSCANAKPVNSDNNSVSVDGEFPVICVIYRLETPAGLHKLANPLRIDEFELARLTWPYPGQGSVGVSVATQVEGMPFEHVVKIALDRSQPLEEIRVPRRSFFASSLPVELRGVSEEWDLLGLTRPLSVADLAKVNYHTVELSPDNILFRSRLVQGNKEYLFPENALMSLIVAAGGAAFGIWFSPKE